MLILSLKLLLLYNVVSNYKRQDDSVYWSDGFVIRVSNNKYSNVTAIACRLPSQGISSTPNFVQTSLQLHDRHTLSHLRCASHASCYLLVPDPLKLHTVTRT